MKEVKVLCAISHGYYKPWIDIAFKGQERTWLADEIPDNFQVLHFHATPLNLVGRSLDRIHERIRWTNRYIGIVLKAFDTALTYPFLRWEPGVSQSKLMNMRHDSIHVKSPDSYLTFRWKSRAMMKYALEKYDFDFLFMTTTSSYIRPQTLLELCEGFPSSSFYGGAKAYEGATFAAGSNRFLSRDVVQRIVENKKCYLPQIIEDVSLSQSVYDLGVDLVFLPHLDIDSMENLDSFSDMELSSHYHFRVKSGTLQSRNDVSLMLRLHDRFSGVSR